MTDTPKWKTSAYTITGWVCFGIVIAVVAYDIVLAILKKPTISQYVSARANDQPLFMWIVIGVTLGILLHWFWGKLFGKKK